jgi:hypothetical protein
MYTGLRIKYTLFSSQFNETLILSKDVRKILKYQISLKIRPVGTELFHTDAGTDITRLLIGFRDFANAPKSDATIQTPTILRCFVKIHSGHLLTQPHGNGKDLTTNATYELLRYSHLRGFYWCHQCSNMLRRIGACSSVNQWQSSLMTGSRHRDVTAKLM